MRRLGKIVVLGIFSVTCSCDAPDSSTTHQLDSTSFRSNEWFTEPAALTDVINQIISSWESDPCSALNSRWEPCEMREFEFVSRHKRRTLPDRRDRRKSVLIVDIFQPNSSFVRFKDRIHGYYEIGATWNLDIYDQTVRKVNLPASVGEAAELIGMNQPRHSQHLNRLLDSYRENFPRLLGSGSSHGNSVFGILADLEPSSPFVFLDVENMDFIGISPDSVCRFGQDASYDTVFLRAMRRRAERIADGVEKLMVRHNVGYVNASWGITSNSVLESWREKCGGQPISKERLMTLVDLYAPIMDALFASDDVLVAQASTDRYFGEYSPFDVAAPRYPNKIRVGSVGYLGFDMSSQGDLAPGWKDVFPKSRYDADVYINTGCELVECRRELRSNDEGLWFPTCLSMMHTSGFGSSMFPFSLTSFVTPVALAEAIQLREERALRGEIEDVGAEVSHLKLRPYRDPLLTSFFFEY